MTQSAKMNLFRPAYMDCRVTLTPTELREAAANIDEFLTKKLRRQLEEKCCVHGYVRRGSTQILARSMGQAEHCRFTGDFLFVCKVRVLCFLPEAGQMVDAQVLKVNKGGAYALVVENGRVSEAVRIFVPRDYHIGNEEFDALMEEQVIRVQLRRSRFQANDPFIQAVGTFEGMSLAEVTAPARKGALEPAVAATEGVVTEEEVSEGGYNVTIEEGGFTITQRKAPAPAPAPLPTIAEKSSNSGSNTDSTGSSGSGSSNTNSTGSSGSEYDSESSGSPAAPVTPAQAALQADFAATLAAAAKAQEEKKKEPEKANAGNTGLGGLFGNAE
jgi:DNA-directed RNA polymerase subunit E'/Rpb7